MDIAYERPREKLQKKGVLALTNTELLQVIIGSGNAGMPVAKIARRADKILKSIGVGVSMADLVSIRGLGEVKAGQIIAGIELANRLVYQDSHDENQIINVLSDLYEGLRNTPHKTLLYALFDGGSRFIDDYSQNIQLDDNPDQVIRTLFGNALTQSATSIIIAIGGKQQLLEPTLFELNLARNAYATAALLSIPVTLFVLVGKKGEYAIKEASYGK